MESVQEAASNYLGKAAKIDTAVDGIFAEHLRGIGQDERERVAEYTATRVPGMAQSRKAKGKKMAGDFIICDDYKKGLGTVPATILGGVATAAMALGGYGVWASMQNKTEPPPVVEAVDTNTQIAVE